MTSNKTPFMLLTIFLSFIAGLECEVLKAIPLIRNPTSLELNSLVTSALYDGDDSIFINVANLHPSNYTRSRIMKYSISSNTFSLHLQTQDIHSGKWPTSFQMDGDGNFFYFCGRDPANGYVNVISVRENNGSENILSELPYDMNLHGSSVPIEGAGDVYIFPSVPSGPALIQKFDIQQPELNPEIVGVIDFPIHQSSGISIGKESLLLFTRSSGSMQKKTFILKLTTMQSKELPLTLHNGFDRIQSVYDGRNVLIISNLDGINGIIKFNPWTFQRSFFPIEEFPSIEGNVGDEEANVIPIYVEKLQRIYLFGAEGISNQVFYVDTSVLYLTHENFQCDGKENGLYRHTKDCSLYVICNGGSEHSKESGDLQKCDPKQHFNDETKNCQDANSFDCREDSGTAMNKAQSLVLALFGLILIRSYV